MYLKKLIIENFRCFGEGKDRFEVELAPGLSALVGANDAGKTAVVDALRFALGTSDQDWARIEDSDFNNSAKPIRIGCQYVDLDAKNLAAFFEYLTYGTGGGKPSLFVQWSVDPAIKQRRGRPYRRPSCTSGADGKGAEFSQEARYLLQATYLRPLRDTEAALTAGRGSRLAQVLHQSSHIKKGSAYDGTKLLSDQKLSIASITTLLNELLANQEGVKDISEKINQTLTSLALLDEGLQSAIHVSGADQLEDARLRELLEKLDLRLTGKGRLGLGSDNLLFMACELLLLSQDDTGSNRMLLIEEPEAHLHAQRQLQVMKALQTQAKEKQIQVIVTTHSSNLSSAIALDNLVIVSDRRGFPLTSDKTLLDASDYRFLTRYLDSTRANLFFARAVVVVEGAGENILLPTLASLLDRDFTSYGVSIVNVGSTGLGRYARIFRRRDAAAGSIKTPVACITDMDVRTNCSPSIMGAFDKNGKLPENRRWKMKSDFADAAALAKHRADKGTGTDGEHVKTFVADEWTFEYDLALGALTNGAYPMTLAKDVAVAIALAKEDEKIHAGGRKREEVEAEGEAAFEAAKAKAAPADGCTTEEVLATTIYAGVGKLKGIAAQYLAERLIKRFEDKSLDATSLRAALPKYLIDAITYVTKPFAAPQV